MTGAYCALGGISAAISVVTGMILLADSLFGQNLSPTMFLVFTFSGFIAIVFLIAGFRMDNLEQEIKKFKPVLPTAPE